MGLLAAAVAIVPAGLRLTAAVGLVCNGLAVWTTLIAAATGPMIVAVLVLRQARLGLRSLRGDDPAPRVAAFALWFVLTFAVLGAIGALLRATTHHHALAGATFGLLGVGVATSLAVVSARTVSVAARWPEPVRWVALGTAGACAGLVVAVARQKLTQSGAIATPTLVDVSAFVIAAAFASRPQFAQLRPIALFGPPVAGTLLALGISAIHACPPVGDLIAEQAPAFTPMVELIRSH